MTAELFIRVCVCPQGVGLLSQLSISFAKAYAGPHSQRNTLQWAVAIAIVAMAADMSLN